MPSTDAPSLFTRLCTRLTLAAMRRMNRGHLEMRLPDGTIETFGRPGQGARAAMTVLDARFFMRCVLYGDIGFAESYIEGEWETDSVERVVAWAIRNVELPPGRLRGRRDEIRLNLLGGLNRLRHLVRPNSLRTSPRNISEHYDLGNAFYRLWLDETMTYSSALFRDAGQSLAGAQTAKYDRLCRQLRLRPGDRVLEIGCGWGGFAAHAARHYGCKVTAVTISREQHRHASARMEQEGVADLVTVELCDYRALDGRFDRIVSIEMMEALGDKYLQTFCAQIHRLLEPAGLVGLQYITVPDSRHSRLRKGVDFIQRHIFPGSLLLSVGRVNAAFASTSDLFLNDLEDLGSSYTLTLRRWRQNFRACENEVRALGFDSAFLRKWDYYLQYCAAAFATRNVSVVQSIYTRPNNPVLDEPA